MKPAPFSYHAPVSLDEAIRILADVAPRDGRVLAGGQSLVPTMAFRMARPAHLVDINGIVELDRLAIEGETIRIGACVRHAVFYGDDVPGPTGRLLRDVVRYIAHHPIRVRGTFCGSVANADPASEWCCVTATLGGKITARSGAGTRTIAAGEFFQSVMTTDLRDDELVTDVALLLLPEGTRCGFAEFSRRVGDFGIAMVLATYRIEDGLIADPRVGLGGAEATPRRLMEAESVLVGREPVPETFAQCAEVAAAVVAPLEDNNNTIAYRRGLVHTLTRRALEQAR
jgi:aerobic carbon-monoxide dehydrogenase medium subunit